MFVVSVLETHYIGSRGGDSQCRLGIHVPHPPVTGKNQENFAPVIGKNKKNLDIFPLKRAKFDVFCIGYRLNPRKSVN